jgi:very-short-patch-repair endonuclease
MGVVREVSELMAQQNGVISRRQALALGATEGFVRARIINGTWSELSSGVYASSSSPANWERRLRAALLAHPVALVAGMSAAHLHGFEGVRPIRPEVLIPYGGNNRSSIARVIRARHFEDVAVTEISGFHCTSIAETILTLSMRLPKSDIERYVDDQFASAKLKVDDFHPILDRLEYARQRGLRSLRHVIAARASDAYQPPTTELERLLYRLLDHQDLPPYQRQVPFAYPALDATVDAYIDEWGLIAEGDGRRWHNRQRDHDRDRERDNAALAAGLVVVRLTWKMLRYHPEEALATLLAVGKQRSRATTPPPPAVAHVERGHRQA